MRSRSAAVVTVCVTAFPLWAAEARADYATLPSPTAPVRASPPLRARQATVLERRFPRRVNATELVRVSVDDEGRPVRVVALNTLTVTGTGDYSLAIPAPVEDVAAAPGSQSEPGLRTGAVLWQGFSTRRRVLAARITLRPGPAAAALPLRIVVRSGARTEVELRNATAVTTTAPASPVPPTALAQALDFARIGLERRQPVTAQGVPVAGRLRTTKVTAAIRLRVRGVVRLAGGAERLDELVGGRPLRIAGRGALRDLYLTVTVPPAARFLSPPGGESWQEDAGRELHGSRGTLLAVRRLLEAALANEFQAFLSNPDPAGTTRTTYAYRLVELTPAPPRQKDEGRSGGVWVPVAVAMGLIVAAVGGLVLWAHS